MAADFKSPHNSKLTDQQWDELCELIRGGMSTRDAPEYCRKTWGVSYTRSALMGNRRYRELRDDIRAEAAEAARATLDAKVADVAEIAVESVKLLQEERTALRKQIDKLGRGDDPKERSLLTDRLKAVEHDLRQSLAQFNDLLKTTASNSYLDDRLTDRGSKEVEDAITEVLSALEQKLGVETLADRMLAADAPNLGLPDATH